MNNQPAFPVLIVDRPKELEHFNGMTLRDYFAAKSMQTFLDSVGWKSDQKWFDEIAEGAYKTADAMLKARE